MAPLKRIGAVQLYRRHFEVLNPMKLLLFWAADRKLERDIVYRTYVESKDAAGIEDRLPDEIAYTCFSGYSKSFGNDAAGYGEVYVYAGGSALQEIRRRFPEQGLSKRRAYYNLFALEPDSLLERKIEGHELPHSSVSLPQLYVDLWNREGWVAHEFLKKTEARMVEAYER